MRKEKLTLKAILRINIFADKNPSFKLLDPEIGGRSPRSWRESRAGSESSQVSIWVSNFRKARETSVSGFGLRE